MSRYYVHTAIDSTSSLPEHTFVFTPLNHYTSTYDLIKSFLSDYQQVKGVAVELSKNKQIPQVATR